jgi:hypothetical protein
MSIPASNGATGASGTGPALGYILNLFWFNFLFMLTSKNNMNTCTYFIHTLSLIYTIKLLVIFGIKIYRKLSSYLTLQLLNGTVVWQSIDHPTDTVLPSTRFLLSYKTGGWTPRCLEGGTSP